MKPAGRQRLFRLGLLAMVCMLVTGCASRILAKKIVQAPNRSGLRQEGFTAEDLRKTERVPWTDSWGLRVGPPQAELQVCVLEPGDYRLKHQLTTQSNPVTRREKMSVTMEWDKRGAARPAVKGTVIVLHGIYVSKEAMLHWALYLAQAGYRCVLLDQRGHGQSTGKWITYGAVEARDMSQLIDELQRRGLAGDRVGVLGLSYGASVGLLLAARDERVGTVVALAPFCTAREAIPEFVRTSLGTMAKKLSDGDFSTALDRAQRLAAFSWEDTDLRPVIGRSQAAMLLYHGERDDWLSPRHSRELIAGAPKGSRLVILPKEDHITLSVRLDPIATDVVAWLDGHLVKPDPAVAEPSDDPKAANALE